MGCNDDLNSSSHCRQHGPSALANGARMHVNFRFFQEHDTASKCSQLETLLQEKTDAVPRSSQGLRAVLVIQIDSWLPLLGQNLNVLNLWQYLRDHRFRSPFKPFLATATTAPSYS